MPSLSSQPSLDLEGADSPIEEEAREEASASLRHVDRTGTSSLAEYAKLLDLRHMSTTATMCHNAIDGPKKM